MRAYLIVQPLPAALDAALASGAEALVLDGAEAGAWTPLLRAARRSGPRLFLCVGTVDGPAIAPELSAAMALAPDAIVFPADHGRDVAHLGARLAVHEAEGGLPGGGTRIVARVASAAGALNAASFAGASPRLSGLAWDARALADALGASCLDEEGRWSAPLAQARGLVRLAAAAAGVEAIEAAGPDDAGLTRRLAAARRDGFGAALASSPAQVPLIRVG